MFENFRNIFKRVKKKDLPKSNSKDMAKERLHLVLMQDRVNVSADFLDLMRVEMVEVLKKYIEIDEREVDIRLTTEINEKGEQSVPALYANIPIIKIKEDTRNLKKNGKTETISMEFLNIEGEKGEKQKAAEVKKDDVLEKSEKQEEKQPEEGKKENIINEDEIKEQMREKLKTEEKDVSKEENQNAEKVEEKEKQEQENIEEKAKQEENENQEEVKKEPETEIKPESETEAKTEPETEAKTETKSETKVEEKKSNKKSKKKSQEKNKNKKDVKEENSNEE